MLLFISSVVGYDIFIEEDKLCVREEDRRFAGCVYIIIIIICACVSTKKSAERKLFSVINVARRRRYNARKTVLKTKKKQKKGGVDDGHDDRQCVCRNPETKEFQPNKLPVILFSLLTKKEREKKTE